MDANILIALIVVIALAIATGAWMTIRSREIDLLRGRFGEKFNRANEQKPVRGRAGAMPKGRNKCAADLTIRPLRESERCRFAQEWHEVRSAFAETPGEAIIDADRVLAAMMAARGFPLEDLAHREKLDLSHADIARHYLAGHAIAVRHKSGDASPEDVRHAMQHYEALYGHLVHDAEGRQPPFDAAPRPRETWRSDNRRNSRDGRDGSARHNVDGEGRAGNAWHDWPKSALGERPRTNAI